MGLSFNILRQIGGDQVQPLRYVLKNQDTGTVLFHVTFTLIPEKTGEESADDEEKTDGEEKTEDIDPELD
jgi:hypothetical protein